MTNVLSTTLEAIPLTFPINEHLHHHHLHQTSCILDLSLIPALTLSLQPQPLHQLQFE
jgi:hypothetical protein